MGRVHRSRAIRILSSAFTCAKAWGWVEINPCRDLQTRHQADRPRRFIPAEELAKFRKVAKNPIAVLALDLTLLTGRQSGELIDRKWSQVDEASQELLFRNRSNEKVAVSITPELAVVLAECRKRSPTSKYVLCSREGKKYTTNGFRAIWQRTMRVNWAPTGNDRFDFHDLRHTFEQRKRNDSQTPPKAREVSRHSQFSQELRDEAARMSEQYEVMYCLENSIRDWISDVLRQARGDNWWTSGLVPPDVLQYSARAEQQERDVGFTARSLNPIDFITFGHLSQILIANAELFKIDDKDKRGLEATLKSLNVLRSPIAHNCEMAAVEIERLRVQVQTWFSLQTKLSSAN
jgi:hypothetical protein